jgi:hypothetical protein
MSTRLIIENIFPVPVEGHPHQATVAIEQAFRGKGRENPQNADNPTTTLFCPRHPQTSESPLSLAGKSVLKTFS